MKYHIHVHALVTFGGLSDDGAWIYPKDKHKIDKYRSICASYKAIFIKELRSLHKSGKITYHNDFEVLITDVEKNPLGCSLHTPDDGYQNHRRLPGKIYKPRRKFSNGVNRVAVSNKRLDYIKDSEKVILLHNDYKNQQVGQVAPKVYKIMDPLVAIDHNLCSFAASYSMSSRHTFRNPDLMASTIIHPNSKPPSLMP
jgi:hypothetical protein